MMGDDFRKIFSRNLKYYMAREGKNQADMVKRLGISSASASDWCNERKVPRADKLQGICDWLGITMSQLMDPNDPYDRPKANSDEWYSDPAVRRMAEKMRTDGDYRILFEAASNVRPEDLEVVTEIIKRFAK